MTDPNFSGINPHSLLKTINSLEGSGKRLHGAKTSYLSRFQKYGLETGSLTEIGKIASWVDDELPMLRRRQALAAAIEMEGGYGPKAPMIQLREPIATVAEARKDGKELADAATQAGSLDPGKSGAEFHRIAEILGKHKGDPDFTSAFYAKMDPELLRNLPVAVAAANSPTAKNDAKLFGAAFTTAVSSETPAPGFNKAFSLFQGDIPRDQPGAVFNRALMQSSGKSLGITPERRLPNSAIPPTRGRITQGFWPASPVCSSSTRTNSDRKPRVSVTRPVKHTSDVSTRCHRKKDAPSKRRLVRPPRHRRRPAVTRNASCRSTAWVRSPA